LPFGRERIKNAVVFCQWQQNLQRPTQSQPRQICVVSPGMSLAIAIGIAAVLILAGLVVICARR
jgi:hypothetical protein